MVTSLICPTIGKFNSQFESLQLTQAATGGVIKAEGC